MEPIEIKPEADKEADYSLLQHECQEYLDFFEADFYNEDFLADYENAIVEAAMEAIFGESVYVWISKKMREHELLGE